MKMISNSPNYKNSLNSFKKINKNQTFKQIIHNHQKEAKFSRNFRNRKNNCLQILFENDKLKFYLLVFF